GTSSCGRRRRRWPVPRSSTSTAPTSCRGRSATTGEQLSKTQSRSRAASAACCPISRRRRRSSSSRSAESARRKAGAVVFEMSAQAPLLQVPQPKRRFGRSGEGTLRERAQGVAFALPALVVLGLFVVYPAYYTVRLAFYKSDYLFNFTNYIGLQNFKDLFQDTDFFDVSHFPPSGALFNNLRWVIVYISLTLVLGL